MTTTFYWHDYETWGTDPRRDRAAQFAGMRTDMDFNPVGRPLMVYAKPADDMLPQPGACMVTGITPQHALQEGVCEADFFAAIHDEMARPGTCSLGYNSIRFDDEFTRYGLYRNFHDPYAREWQNGNSRWDIIDMVRLTHALRPDGIEWPQVEGVTSFRLEKLTAANGIEHQGAHDALVDVKATIALAKLVKEKQPRLFDFVFNNRNKHQLAEQLDPRQRKRVVHVSDKYPARLGCMAVVAPLARHPTNRNGIIVYDLRVDPEPLIRLDADEIRERIFTPAEQLPEGQQRVALKTIHVNHAPVVVPLNTLDGLAREKWELDEQRELAHWQVLLETPGLSQKIQAVFSENPFPPNDDPDQSLYDGFISNADRRLCEKVRQTAPERLGQLRLHFEDAKLHELLFRYRARNWPETLSNEERQRWDDYRRQRLQQPDGGSSITLSAYRRELAALAVDASLSDHQRQVVDALLDWPQYIGC